MKHVAVESALARSYTFRAAVSFCTLLLTTGAAPEQSKEVGRLCFAEGSQPARISSTCLTTEGRRFEVRPADKERKFVWFQSKGREIAAATLPANEAVVDLDSKEWLEVPLTIVASDMKQWPENVSSHLEVVGSETPKDAWTWEIDRRVVSDLRKLKVRNRTHDLHVTAAHHKPASRRMSPNPKKRHDLGAVVLVRFPTISGQLLSRTTKEPVAGAAIVLPSEKTLAISDGSGRFTAEVAEEDWPEFVRVVAADLAPRVISVPKLQADVVFPTIHLSRGGTLRATITRPADSDDAGAITAHLTREMDDARAGLKDEEWKPVLRRNLDDSNELQLENLEPGNYRLLLRGLEPLEQHSTSFKIEEGTTTEESIEIEPVTVEVEVRLGKEPIGGAALGIEHRDYGWKGDIRTDALGLATAPLWQEGEFAGFVRLPKGAGGHFVLKKLTGPGPIRWSIELPDRKIVGRVVGGPEKRPVTDAAIVLESGRPGARSQRQGKTDASGRFEFVAVPEGQQSLSVSAPGFVRRQLAVEFPESVSERQVVVELQEGTMVLLLVTNAMGVPVPGAMIFDASAPSEAPLITDFNGRVEIPLKPGERSVVCVMPKEGSFAIATITAPRGAADRRTVTVQVPPGEALIQLSTKTSAGLAVPLVGLAVRYNGYMVPPRVTDMMGPMHGNFPWTDQTGSTNFQNMPLGHYEFWPYRGRAELEGITRTLPPAAAQLAATPGQNRVNIQVEAAPKR